MMEPASAARHAPPAAPRWRLRDVSFELDRPILAGVLNVTPDSFSDGGRYLRPADALRRADSLIENGADFLDLGGESTRPGAAGVSADEEWNRLAPVLEGLRDAPVPLSVDTTKAEVARRALDHGVRILNDVSGLAYDPELADLAAASGAGLVLMHMRGSPRTMQEDTLYGDLPGEVRETLSASVAEAVRRGCDREQLVVDPGIGFGKALAGNLELLWRIDRLAGLGLPVMIGPSRKSFLGQILNLPPAERVEGTIAACLVARLRGAHIFRVHDVESVKRALDVGEAIMRTGETP